MNFPETFQSAMDLFATCFKRAMQEYAENQSLKKENEKLKQEIEIMRTEGETRRRENETMAKQIVTLQKERQNLQLKHEQLSKEVLNLENDKSRLKLKIISGLKQKQLIQQRRGDTKRNSITEVICEEGVGHAPVEDHRHTPSPEDHRHTPSPGDQGHTPSPPLLNKRNTTVSLFPSPSSTSPNSEEEASMIIEGFIPAHTAQGLFESVAVSKGNVLHLTSSSPKKGYMHNMESMPGEGRSKNVVTCVAAKMCDHSSKTSSLKLKAPDCTLCSGAGQNSTSSDKLLYSCDQTCDVTRLASDVQEDSCCSLPVVNFKGRVHPGERGEQLSMDQQLPLDDVEPLLDSDRESITSATSTDNLSPSLLTSKQAGFIPYFPPHNSNHINIASTRFVPSVGLASSNVRLGTLALSPIQRLPIVEGIPLTDSQCSLDTTETQPPSPKIDSSRCEVPSQKRSHPEDPNTRELGSSMLLSPTATQGNQSFDQTCTPDEEKRRRRRRRRRRGLKQTTLTQVLPDGSLSLATPTIVAVTPGVRPVDAILSDHKSTLFLNTKEEDRRRPEEESEEVLPSKRQWRSPDVLTEDGSQWKDLEGREGLEEKGLEEEEEEGEDGENTLIECGDEKNEYAKKLAKTAGLPSYKFVVPIRKKSDRDKLDAKPCPDCQKWFSDGDGIHGDQREHLKQVCRHKHLYLPPDTDPRVWDISFPNTEECERIMGNRN